MGCSCKIKTSSAGGPLGLRQTKTRGEGGLNFLTFRGRH